MKDGSYRRPAQKGTPLGQRYPLVKPNRETKPLQSQSRYPPEEPEEEFRWGNRYVPVQPIQRTTHHLQQRVLPMEPEDDFPGEEYLPAQTVRRITRLQRREPLPILLKENIPVQQGYLQSGATRVITSAQSHYPVVRREAVYSSTKHQRLSVSLAILVSFMALSACVLMIIVLKNLTSLDAFAILERVAVAITIYASAINIYEFHEKRKRR